MKNNQGPKVIGKITLPEEDSFKMCPGCGQVKRKSQFNDRVCDKCLGEEMTPEVTAGVLGSVGIKVVTHSYFSIY